MTHCDLILEILINLENQDFLTPIPKIIGMLHCFDKSVSCIINHNDASSMKQNNSILYRRALYLLIFSFHHLDVLSELNNSLSVWLEPKLRNHFKLNLSAKWKHYLLIPVNWYSWWLSASWWTTWSCCSQPPAWPPVSLPDVGVTQKLRELLPMPPYLCQW